MKALRILAATSLVLTSFAAVAAYTPGAGIKGTPHDWSSPVATGGTSGGQSLLLWCTTAACTPDATTGVVPTTTYNTGYAYMVNGKQGTTRVQIGLCTKCHTPHQAKSTTLLWNHTLQSISYSWDVTATTAGTVYPTIKADTYKGPTTKCLSCHDGLLASTDGMWFNRQFVSGAKYVAPAGSLNSGHEVAEGTNLSKTHPVAMPYPFGGAGGQYNGTTTGVSLVTDEFVADPTAVGVRLFNDDGSGEIVAGPVAGKTGMECTSCHDVHNGKRTVDQLLLTGKMTGSELGAGGYICTQCHKK